MYNNIIVSEFQYWRYVHLLDSLKLQLLHHLTFFFLATETPRCTRLSLIIYSL